MITPIVLAVIGLIIGALALSKATWRTVIAYCACLAIVGSGLLYEAGRPKPVWSVIQPKGKATLAGFQFAEPNAIYLWVVWAGTSTPISYSIPWSEPVAEQIMKAEQEAKEQHTSVSMRGLPTHKKFPGSGHGRGNQHGNSKGQGNGKGNQHGNGHGADAQGLGGAPNFYPEPQPSLPPKASR